MWWEKATSTGAGAVGTGGSFKLLPRPTAEPLREDGFRALKAPARCVFVGALCCNLAESSLLASDKVLLLLLLLPLLLLLLLAPPWFNCSSDLRAMGPWARLAGAACLPAGFG